MSMALGFQNLCPRPDQIRVACGGISPISKSICTGPTKVQHPTFSGSCGEALAGRGEPANTKSSKVESLAKVSAGAVACTLSFQAIASMSNFPPFSAFNPVGGHQVAYQRTKDRNLPNLDHAGRFSGWDKGRSAKKKYRLTKKREKQD